jgi:hypothetical protein
LKRILVWKPHNTPKSLVDAVGNKLSAAKSYARVEKKQKVFKYFLHNPPLSYYNYVVSVLRRQAQKMS